MFKGDLFLLYVQKDQNYQVVGGMKVTKFVLNQQLLDVSTKDSGQWRLLLEEAGIRSLILSGQGIFTDSEAEKLIQNSAFTAQALNYHLAFGNDACLFGRFMIANYERAGNYDNEEQYSLTLESSGTVTYQDGAKL